MYALHPILVIFLWVSPSNQISRDLTYEELDEIDGTCHTLDTCNVPRTSDSLDKYTCQCASECSELDTCCIDSPFRDKSIAERSLTCRPVNGGNETHYYMVDHCSSSNRDREIEKLCREDWKPEDNLLSLVPVTSVSSQVTYKNYFCYKCNEATDDFVYWNVRLNSDISSTNYRRQDILPTYDTNRQTWMAPIVEDTSVPVSLFFEIPAEIQKIPKVCIPNVISSCSGRWKIRDVKSKCGKYTSYIYIVKNGINISYKNPHCALCNFESLERMGCGVTTITRTDTKKLFSFTMLLDINPSGGDKVGQIVRCNNNSVWDPFFNKCRTYKCAIPWYVIKNGKCTPP